MAIESVASVTLETGNDHPREARTVDELRRLLAKYDLHGLQWTSRVRVEYRSMPHSHPGLTLNLGLPLLSTYVHEQLHWWTNDHPGMDPATAATSREWPMVPNLADGGARSELSTRLHLLVCHLQHRTMELVVGADTAAQLLEDNISVRRIYPWVYRQVQHRADVLDDLCGLHSLWPARLETP